MDLDTKHLSPNSTVETDDAATPYSPKAKINAANLAEVLVALRESYSKYVPSQRKPITNFLLGSAAGPSLQQCWHSSLLPPQEA